MNFKSSIGFFHGFQFLGFPVLKTKNVISMTKQSNEYTIMLLHVRLVNNIVKDNNIFGMTLPRRSIVVLGRE